MLPVGIAVDLHRDWPRPDLHDRAFAELALDLSDRQVYGAFPFRHWKSSLPERRDREPGHLICL